MGSQVLIFDRADILFLLHCIHTSSGVHLDLVSVGTRSSVLKAKAYNSPLSVAKVKSMLRSVSPPPILHKSLLRSVSPPPILLHGMVLN
jgi:hypothetical protein